MVNKVSLPHRLTGRRSLAWADPIPPFSLVVGPVSGKNLVLPPKSVTSIALTGTILQTSSSDNLNALGTLFSQFLTGRTSNLTVTGDSVVSPAQPGSPVTWLSAAFKTLVLPVALEGHVYEVISSVSLHSSACGPARSL